VIARAVAPLLDRFAGRRRRQLEGVWRRPADVQEVALRSLLWSASDTEFGLEHGFRSIRTVAEYQERVPIREYPDFKPLWTRAVSGARGVTWPGRCRDWVKTSGTTSGDKMIPVTREAFVSHRKGGWDALLLACSRVGARHLMDGPMMFLGGSTALKETGAGCRVGDLSGLAMRRLPHGIRGRYSPGPRIGAIADWERRIEAVADLAATQDLRLISGMPSWLVILFERIARHRQAAGLPMRDLSECWPNLRVLIHGGVAFAPYAEVFEEWMGRRLERIEVYPASEGFVGVQTEASGGLTLMLDYGIFYEFVPVEDVGSARPRRHTVADLELHRPYAVVMSTPGGLWSYLLGDTVRFVARDPLRLVITGRTRHYVNAFGENVIVEEVERALTTACRRTEAETVEFTVAPRYPSAGEPRGGHEWLVEFRIPPREPEDFARVLDETLVALNTDYRSKRAGGVGMVAPSVTTLPPGTFYRWMRENGKLGDQHKVPRVTNDRKMADALLAAAAGSERPLQQPVSA
jgi:GH3 auxin-responsive promoter